MKAALTLLVSLAFLGNSFAGLPESVKGRRLGDVKIIPGNVLKRSVSPKFYKSLMMSPIEGWVVARGTLAGHRVYGERIIRSDVSGDFNKLALQVLRDIKIAGDNNLDSQLKTSTVLLHLLVYKIADGTMVLYFPTLAGAGEDQEGYWGSAKLAVLKSNGTWTEIQGPRALQGKGFAVRRTGHQSDGVLAMKMEQIGGVSAEGMLINRTR
jgi:hypothetical protein